MSSAGGAGSWIAPPRPGPGLRTETQEHPRGSSPGALRADSGRSGPLRTASDRFGPSVPAAAVPARATPAGVDCAEGTLSYHLTGSSARTHRVGPTP